MSNIKSKALKFLAVFVAFNILLDTIFPTVVLALTNGPKSPEFMSFTPVATTNMVDLTSGDFNYNIPVLEIPGPEGGGYALSLAYNSGVNCEQEASWVGLGWNINPGAIDRNMRGFPDDYDGAEVKYYNKKRPSYTISASESIAPEIFSKDSPGKISINFSQRFNNHSGYYSSRGLSLSFMGQGLSLTHDVNGITFSPQIGLCPSSVLLKNIEIPGKLKKFLEAYPSYGKRIERKSSGIDIGSIFSYQEMSKSTSFSAMKGASFNFSVGLEVNPSFLPIGLQVGLQANVNYNYEEYFKNRNAYGFMYKPQLEYSLFPNAIMDYYSEKGDNYSNRDLYIGQPFSNADIFSVSGEGLAGGFRAFKDRVVNYHPDLASSKTYSYNVGLEFGVGWNNGFGLDVGIGVHKNSMNSWGENHLTSNNILRFNGDLGGKIEYGANSNTVINGQLYHKSKVPGFKRAGVKETNIYSNSELDKKSAGSVKYVDYKTFSEIMTNSKNSFTRNLNFSDDLYKDYSVGSSSNKKYLLKNEIAEYSITNESGDNYVYGIPVLTRNETNLSFDITAQSTSQSSSNAHEIKNRYLAYRETPLIKNGLNYGVSESSLNEQAEIKHRSIVGEIRNIPYASSYLLSQITTSNYIDITDNGPTNDDFGGWTKFNYRQVYGGKGDWYRYRAPYKGLIYSQNSISDVFDDLGSVSTGEKEVYYLEAIETKTHIAFFVTNKYVHNTEKYPEYEVKNQVKSRLDGRGANSPDTGKDSFSELNNDKSSTELEYLVKIVLFAKARPNKPIKTINFAYDYSLIPNLPNNYNTNNTLENSTDIAVENTGKLTLKKVWFEYEGNTPVKISPYEFSYVYSRPNHFETGGELFKEYENLSDGLGSVQNPTYSPYILDPWGNLMPYGKERKKYDIPWIYQGKNPKFEFSNERSWRKDSEVTKAFDPAAWHLKSIKLPSGGEIHIQYEQKDYKYVQDRPVMAMASLIGAVNNYEEPYYDINVDDLGCNPESLDQVSELLDKINNYLFDDKTLPNAKKEYVKKIYFKFLFGLTSNTPSLDNPNSEYITGYSRLRNIEIVPFTKANKQYYTLRFHLGSSGTSSGERTNTPRKGAHDFLVNQRRGIVKGGTIYGGAQDCVHSYLEDDFTRLANRNEMSLGIAKQFIKIVVPALTTLITPNYNKAKVCDEISLSQSFLKLPMLGSKKGGGIRVKRLLIYDSGIEYGAAKMMGQQFHYVLSDGITTSGVATNEPSQAREENPLVHYMPRKGQSIYSRLTVGEDKKQTEGPLGESLLPNSTVTHSRVVVENIHSDKEITGFTVHEFYTTKDYPFDMSYKPENKNLSNYDYTGYGVEYSPLQKIQDFLPEVSLILFSYRLNNVWMSQGFTYVLNSMNGVKKRITSYGGKYVSDRVDDTKGGYLVQLNDYEYYAPGEKIKMVKPNDEGTGFKYEYDIPGKEEEIVVEGKELKDKIFDINLEFDLSIAWVGLPAVFAGACPSIKMSTETVATHSTTRVLRYPVILKSESSFTDGLFSKTEYVAFNAHTGQPTITKSYDGYYDPKILPEGGIQKGVYYSFSVPASWKYSKMRQKAIDKNNTNQLNEQFITISTYGSEPNPNWFETSDIPNVIGANVTTYDNNWENSWDDPQIANQYSITSNLKEKLSKIWRPKESYIYKKPTTTDISKEIKVFERGFFSIENGVNWTNPAINTNFIKVSEITKYSPNGTPLEELDAMRIPTAVSYGKQYGYNLPVMIAKNARYGDFYFDDFEGYRESWNLTSDKSHSGENSMIYSDNLNVVSNILVSENLKTKGALFKIWISNDYSALSIPKINISNKIISLKKVSSTGDWSLFEGVILPTALPVSNSLFNIALTGIGSVNSVYIDDVRLQPMDAQATCNVYDPTTFKLVAQFDDQHFGVFYKYNGEGVLTHKIVETERGTQTIEERQYNLPKVSR